MANLHETGNLEGIAEIDPFGWLLAALVVVVHRQRLGGCV